MARNSSFHTRHTDRSGNFNAQGGNRDNHSQSRQFDKRGAQPEQHARVDRKAVIRRVAFKNLIADVNDGISKVAIVCELSENRVKRLYEGQDIIDAPMAMHLEESIGLPAGWMESEKPIPQEIIVRLNQSIGAHDAHDEDAFTIDVDGAHETPQSKADGEVIEAFSQPASPSGEPQKADVTDNDEAMMNILQLKDIFPAVHVVLHQKTNLSPASISGILSGSRNLTAANAELFEDALNLPRGWLYQNMTIEQAEADLVKAVGDLINMPAPRRGRRAANETAAQVPAASQPRVRQAREPNAAKAAKPAKPARVLAPMPPAAPAKAAGPAAAAVPQVVDAPAMRPYVETASPLAAQAASRLTLDVVPGGMSLSRALINELEKLDANGQLDNIKVTRVLNALYMN